MKILIEEKDVPCLLPYPNRTTREEVISDLSEIGLRYIKPHRREHSRFHDRITWKYWYEWEVIDEQVFFVNAIKTGVQFQVIKEYSYA